MSPLKPTIRESIDAGGRSVMDPSNAGGFVGSSKMKPRSTYRGSLYLKWRSLRADGGIRGGGWRRKGDGRVLRRRREGGDRRGIDVSPPYPREAIVKTIISSMTKPAYLLDITLLTQLKKDCHPSIYTGSALDDCSHWCLAGVPDTWNHLPYAASVTTK
ncbi:hypothetical protein EZV62_007944 [Acer yangbiense]|uniref:Trichome birefringence-like C-terminal domain-containing protein n=1 Tax=Acer yangbiense TaxID=1000413 RepID=A0A5C7ICR4_9ROSI|nr:hypothetical protein EZV62_007944 [Acer yangbiense]